jgi:hypothetical protein
LGSQNLPQPEVKKSKVENLELPSYLRKSKNNISEVLGSELLTKYKMKFIDLRIAIDQDIKYGYLNKVKILII